MKQKPLGNSGLSTSIVGLGAQPGVTHVLAGGRNLAQVADNAKAGELDLETADLTRIRKDVLALGEPAKE
jgi:aryl-alcohol dehydrogenase-like predicted oxidoreductase